MNIKTDDNNFISEQMVTVNSKHNEKDFFSLVPRACCMEKPCLFVSRQGAECLYRVSPSASSMKPHTRGNLSVVLNGDEAWVPLYDIIMIIVHTNIITAML
jgi:hypothetical protein